MKFSLCRLNSFHFLRTDQHGHNRKKAGRFVRETINMLKPDNTLELIQFSQLIVKDEILNSGEITIELPSKLRKCQDKTQISQFED